MGEAYHAIWVLENYPLGALLAEYLDTGLMKIRQDVDVVPPHLYQELLGVNFANADDETIQEAFLSRRADYSFSGIVVAILHINSLASLNVVKKISQNNVSVLARLPSENGADRDISVADIGKSLSSLGIPYNDYAKLGLPLYQKWMLSQVKSILS